MQCICDPFAINKRTFSKIRIKKSISAYELSPDLKKLKPNCKRILPNLWFAVVYGKKKLITIQL